MDVNKNMDINKYQNASYEFLSNIKTIDSESFLEFENKKEKLKINKDLWEEKEKFNSNLTKLKHESSMEIEDLKNKLITLEKKNSSLKSYLDEIKNSYSNEKTENENEIKELELKIEILESKINLSLENKMELERKNNECYNEISLLKLENTKIKMKNIKFKAKIQEISLEKDIENEKNYIFLTQENLIKLLLEKDENIQIGEIRYEKFENDCYELYCDEIAKEFLNQKKIEYEKLYLSDKLREITYELEALKKEYRDQEKEILFNKKIPQGLIRKNTLEITKLKESLKISKKNTNSNIDYNSYDCNSDDEAFSFDSQEVQILVKNYQESEKALIDMKSEYDKDKKKWEFEIKRLESLYNENEKSMKLHVENLTKINEDIRLELSEVQNMHKKNINFSESENLHNLLIENEEFNIKILELEDNLCKNDYNYKENLFNLRKELMEKDEYINKINTIKDNLNKDIDILKCSFAKKENEIFEKNRIEIDIKNKENLRLIEKIEILNKEILEKKNEINSINSNYYKLLKNYETLSHNQSKTADYNKREIERLILEKEKIKILCNKDISEKINEVNTLKEKIKELEKLNSKDNIKKIFEHKKSLRLNEILEDKNENENLSLEKELNKKEEKIANLEIELNSLYRKIKKNEDLENEIEHLKNLTNTQATNLIKQKEIYEKHIHEFQKKYLDINVDLISQRRRSSISKNNPNLFNKQIATFIEMDTKLKNITVENKYHKEQLIIIKDELEKNKIARENDVNFYKQELIKNEKFAIYAKFELANISYEKDCEIVKLRNLYKKYKMKLINIFNLNSNPVS
jgi:reticulocyte-binding protein